MLSALRHSGFRRYFAAQAVSGIGTWVQITVENWLVLQLSHSGLALGITNALQFGPSLLLGLYGGVVADRRDRRRLLMMTQTCLGLLAVAVGVLAGIGAVRVWMIWLAAAALGVVKPFDMPALQAFVKDLVGPDDLANAVALSNVVSAAGRMIRPALGGLVLAALGAAPAFLINAASFAVVVLALASLRPGELSARTPVPRGAGQIREGLHYLGSELVLAATTALMIVVFISAYNFQVSLALIAADTLRGNSQEYGMLMSALGLGAVAGSLALARRKQSGLPVILAAAYALAVAQVAETVACGMPTLLAATFAYGASAGLFSVSVVGVLQSHTVDAVRGRVMAVYSVCFLASSLTGGPGFGALAGAIGVGGALRATAGICVLAALARTVFWRGRRSAFRVIQTMYR